MKFNSVTAAVSAFLAMVSSALGIMALPLYMMASCNIIDYFSGLMASWRRGEKISSYKGMEGIAKKICLWFLVIIGSIIDHLVMYASDMIGFKFPFAFPVACIVALWIVCNEIISILENIADIGVAPPAFLAFVVKLLKRQIDEQSNEE